MKVSIITDPKAGKGKAASAARYTERLLKRRGITAAVNYTDSKDRTRKLAVHCSFRNHKVIAVGNDEIINEIVNCVAGTKCILGVVPVDAKNNLSSELRIPNNVEKAAAIAVENNTKKIDLGRVGTHYFSNLCTIGFDAKYLTEVESFIDKIFAGKSYSSSLAKKQIGVPSQHLLIKVDDSFMTEGCFIAISNSKYYKGTRSLARETDLSDGFLDVLVFNKGKMNDFLKYTSKVLSNSISIKDGEYHRIKELKINSESPVLVQTDGKIVGTTPISVSINPKSLEVAIPKN